MYRMQQTLNQKSSHSQLFRHESEYVNRTPVSLWQCLSYSYHRMSHWSMAIITCKHELSKTDINGLKNFKLWLITRPNKPRPTKQTLITKERDEARISLGIAQGLTCPPPGEQSKSPVGEGGGPGPFWIPASCFLLPARPAVYSTGKFSTLIPREFA